ncbi:hypothetical protein [Streptomyces sp. NBC_00576]|uniref:hypothetical protein n=1 Tax=Streptomyces sp. NBC_00576 TaxID=2903665 RepID=UPI002E7FD4E4|nr:hypothetical protein [Streptomyces sp. NBC_00576]WUB70929.1 hypothetical protein OG734_12985 [Streptomyces sp. NBC_00576]
MTAGLRRSVDEADRSALADALDTHGCALTPELLGPDKCREIAELYERALTVPRSRIATVVTRRPRRSPRPSARHGRRAAARSSRSSTGPRQRPPDCARSAG